MSDQHDRLSWIQRLRIEILAFLLVWVVRLWFGTVRVDILSEDVYERFFRGTETGNVVAGSWHRHSIFLFYFFRNLGPRGVMISRSRDGELTARIATRFGYTPIRGSSSRGGREALEELTEYMSATHEKRLCGTPVDGPRGPARKMKKGMAVLARESGSWFIPMACSGTNVITLNKAWDKTILPKPFSKMVIDFGEPVRIPKEASGEEFSAICQELEEDLDRVTDRVDRVCGYEGPQLGSPTEPSSPPATAE